MRYITATSLLLLVAVLWPSVRTDVASRPRLPLDEGPPRVETAYHIRGVVQSAESGEPIKRAQVFARLRGSAQPTLAAVTTGDDGRFAIVVDAVGPIALSAAKEGFVPLQIGAVHPGRSRVEIAGGERDATKAVSLVLAKGATIEGTVLDPFGEPVPNARVQALQSVFANGEPALVQAGFGSSTDDRGRFRLFGLPAGRYAIVAELTHRLGRPTSAREYVVGFHPNSTTAKGATLVNLGPGQEFAGADIRLSVQSLVDVSGRVELPRGEGLSGVVRAVPERLLRTGMGAGATTPVSRNGEFRFEGLAPDNYVLQAAVRDAQGATIARGASRVDVEGARIGDLEIRTRATGIVRGRIAPIHGLKESGLAPVEVEAVALDESVATDEASLRQRLGDDGVFEFSGLVGRVLLRVTPASGRYGWSVAAGGEDVTNTPFGVKPSGVVNLVVSLSESIGSVNGEVVGRSGAVSNGAVVMFPIDRALWVPQSDLIRFTQVQPTGRFEFPGVPSEVKYAVGFVPELVPGEAFSPPFLESLRGRATRGVVRPGQTLELLLRAP